MQASDTAVHSLGFLAALGRLVVKYHIFREPWKYLLMSISVGGFGFLYADIILFQRHLLCPPVISEMSIGVVSSFRSTKSPRSLRIFMVLCRPLRIRKASDGSITQRRCIEPPTPMCHLYAL